MTSKKNKIEDKKITDLIPDSQNANIGTERGLRELDNSLASVGLGRSVVTDKHGRIIAGNKTVERAADRGFEDAIVVHTDGKQLVVVQRDDLDLSDDSNGNKARALAYFDNRVAELDLHWNPIQIQADKDSGVEIVDKLWSPVELDILGVGDGEQVEDPGADVDRAAELNEKWQVKRGDVWTLASEDGKRTHRIMCGDATCAGDVDKLGRLDVLITDPPYGINRDPKWLDGVYQHRQALSSRDIIAGDDGSLNLSFLFEFERRMIWGFPYIYDANATGWIVWDKQPGVESRGIVTPIEMASTTMRKGFDMIRCMWGGYYRDKGETSQPHPTQKPIGVVKPFIEQWVKQNEIVFDPFLGSGTTMLACEMSNRICVGLEIDPKYCAVILQRMSDFGLTPERLSDA